jgi:hypothetical protein
MLAIGLVMLAGAAFAASPLGIPPIPQPGDDSRDPSNKELTQKSATSGIRDAKSATSGIRDAKSLNPAQDNKLPNGKSTGEVEGTQTAVYTVPVACPQDSTLTMTVPANNLPPLWSPSGGRRLALSFAAVNDVAGKQELSCHYDLQGAAVPDVTALRRSVNLSSCIIAPDKRSFRCRQGRL